jgi:hypothetical protein
MDTRGDQSFKPSTVHGDFAKPPAALALLRTRPQWVIWRLTRRGDRWTKPPYRCDEPQHFASSSDPSTWSSYEVAIAAAAAGAGDGISYVLTPEDPFAAVDIDHVRNRASGAVAGWAQRLLEQANYSYVEISPSGTGLRIWGTADGGELHRKFTLEHAQALELFRHTCKPLTVTGLQLGHSRQLGNIDALLDRAVMWAQQQQKLSKAKPASSGSITAGATAQYSLNQIEQIVREGAPEGANRSDTFHTIVGHYLGCGWGVEQIVALLEQHPGGIGERYIVEGRLLGEVERSAQKYRPEQPGLWSSGWKSEQQPELLQQEPEMQDPESEPLQQQEPKLREEPQHGDIPPAGPQLPPMYAHGDPDPRPIKRWTFRKLIPVCGVGLLSGQWGTYKTFMALEIGASAMTGQSFRDYLVRRQCGVLFLPAEGADEIRLRTDALVREKCGNLARAPFRWFEAVPVLLHPGGVELLIAMAKQADASLRQEFGLPLGLVFIDTIAASAGFSMPGSENDAAVGAQVMGVLRRAAEATDSFWFGIDHFGKNIDLGTRGSSSKEASADLVLACLGERELSGRVLNLRLAVRKCRGGPSGQEFPFSMREVMHPQLDEEGKPQSTLVVDWTPAPAAPAGPEPDPWEDDRQHKTRQAMVLLKRVLMAKLAEHGVEIYDGNGTRVRGIDKEIVRKEFFAQTVADGTPKQKSDFRSVTFKSALGRAQERQLIGIREISDTVTYLWLLPRKASAEPDEEF